MAFEITVPSLGESVTEATVARWHKAAGDQVQRDEPLVELETDKVTLEVNAKEAGTLREILVQEGTSVAVGEILGIVGDGVAASGSAEEIQANQHHSPAVRRLLAEHNLDAGDIAGTGKDNRLTKGDVLEHLKQIPSKKDQAPPPRPAIEETGPVESTAATTTQNRQEERVRMSRLRQRIAERLKEAQNTAAMLTTFNEVDMTRVMEVRQSWRDEFEKRHGCRLGLMSFFVKACVAALKEIPEVNAEIQGEEIVYKNYYDIGVAVGTEQGLVVPVIRNADTLSFAETEQTIAGLGERARAGKLTISELSGGTFTITNGGVYGSMLSTPILNPPQSGILGMHRVDRRPIAVGDEIRIRPMMYVALSYDHRLIDGREAVTFLVRVKQCLEDPERILLAI